MCTSLTQSDPIFTRRWATGWGRRGANAPRRSAMHIPCTFLFTIPLCVFHLLLCLFRLPLCLSGGKRRGRPGRHPRRQGRVEVDSPKVGLPPERHLVPRRQRHYSIILSLRIILPLKGEANEYELVSFRSVSFWRTPSQSTPANILFGKINSSKFPYRSNE